MLNHAKFRSLRTDVSGHGSMPPGEFKNGIYTALKTADETGPWLYDSAKDDFEYARTVGNRFTSFQHAPMAYDASSDVVYSLGETELFIYSVQLNKVFRRALPIELHRRRNYGAAVDPVQSHTGDFWRRVANTMAISQE